MSSREPEARVCHLGLREGREVGVWSRGVRGCPEGGDLGGRGLEPLCPNLPEGRFWRCRPRGSGLAF